LNTRLNKRYSQINKTMEKRLKAFVSTTNPAVAKQFYQDVLELELLEEDDFGLEFDANGTRLRISIVQQLTSQPFTVLGWEVHDIKMAIATLNAKGILFERYAFLQQDPLGIWTAPGGKKVGWFKDPDGNILSFSE
jgi:catechol 2,3-dioxygenase-like lactoylglutathione lyase family enzyme